MEMNINTYMKFLVYFLHGFKSQQKNTFMRYYLDNKILLCKIAERRGRRSVQSIFIALP
jgi:hypothetical protein